MIVFGDSLSDNGNLYEYMKRQLPLSPPYYQGRFTNGPVWVELLMKYYYPTTSDAHLFDYAFGGAGVLDDDDDDGVFTLRREMDSYFLAHDNVADAKSMYVIWIGSNNYIAVPDDVEKSLSDVSIGIQHALQRLVDKGAKHIMVVNVPDLGSIPAARDFDAVEELTYLSTQHNLRLEKQVLGFQTSYPDVQWLFLDVNTVMKDMILHPEKYGFTNVTDTCYEEVTHHYSSKANTILELASSVKTKNTPNACDGYLFFDPVHPSAPVHQLMAERTKVIFDDLKINFQSMEE
jgi:phospholipase/lecithinase/hemolysin